MSESSQDEEIMIVDEFSRENLFDPVDHPGWSHDILNRANFVNVVQLHSELETLWIYRCFTVVLKKSNFFVIKSKRRVHPGKDIKKEWVQELGISPSIKDVFYEGLEDVEKEVYQKMHFWEASEFDKLAERTIHEDLDKEEVYRSNLGLLHKCSQRWEQDE